MGDDNNVTEEQINAAREAAKAAGTGLIDDWRDHLGEDLSTDPSLQSFKSVGDLAKSFIHTKKLVGHDKIPIPADDDPESWNNVFSRLGRPDEPDGYEIGGPEEPPEGFNYNPELEKEYRKEAHKLGLTKKQAAGVWSMLNGKAVEVFKGVTDAQRQKLEADEQALKTEWGSAYEEKLKVAQRAVNALENAGLKGLNDWLKKSGAGKEPMMQRIFAVIGENASEEQLGPGEKRTTLTPTEAKSRIRAIMEDKSNPKYNAYWNKKHPDHREIVEEVLNLQGFTGDEG